MADEVTALVHETIPVLGAMGLRVVEVSPTRAAVAVPHEPNRNHLGTMYAGALFSAAEVLGGLIGLAQGMEGAVPVLKRFEIDFTRPARGEVTARVELSEGEVARLRAEVGDAGRSAFELRATITDEAGEVVATTRGDYQLRRS